MLHKYYSQEKALAQVIHVFQDSQECPLVQDSRVGPFGLQNQAYPEINLKPIRVTNSTFIWSSLLFKKLFIAYFLKQLQIDQDG